MADSDALRPRTPDQHMLLSGRRMRAAAILGLGSSEKDLRPFQRAAPADWTLGIPANSSDADAILIFGGDGTVHRHLPQLVRLKLPVLVVPCGSGNDFARALGLRSVNGSLAAWRDFCAGEDNTRTIDLGLITPLAGGAPAPHGHYFCCVGGVGLDAEVTRRANHLPRWLRGHGGYALSLPGALWGFASHRMKISCPAADGQLAVPVEQPVFMTVFANAPAYGGGMKIAPRARMEDGLLDVCVISEMDKLRLFSLFPTVYFGRHVDVPKVKYFQTERARIEADVPLEVYADGEYVCKTPIEVSISPAALKVVVPAEASILVSGF